MDVCGTSEFMLILIFFHFVLEKVRESSHYSLSCSHILVIRGGLTEQVIDTLVHSAWDREVVGSVLGMLDSLG